MTESDRSWPANRVGVAERFLLRAAAATDGNVAAESWRAFRERIKEGDEPMALRRLLPLVFRNLLRHGQPKDAGLTRAYANSFGANARLMAEAATALRALAGASIETMVLKGTALLVGHYRDVGARPMSDADILVPASRIRDALNVLDGMGWRSDPARRWLNTPQHADAVFSPEGGNVDLHRHATCEASWEGMDRRFFAESVAVAVSGETTRAMAPGDQLIHSVIHGLRWSIARSPIWMIDTLTVLRGGTVDVGRTVERARELRLAFALRSGLETVREVVGTDPNLEALVSHLSSGPPRFSDRLEQHFRVREPAGAFGALPNLWFLYRRSQPFGRASGVGFPRYLKAMWGQPADKGLVPLLAGKAWRRVRQRPRHR